MSLLKIQQTLKAPKGQRNTFGNYNFRSAEDIIEAVKPIAHNYGWILHITDEVVCIGNRYYVKATASLINEKDPTIQISAVGLAREEETKKGMDVAQITGACSSYARKYALNGLLGIDCTKDADATNTHGKDEKKLPMIESMLFGKVVARFNEGERDAFDKASKHYSFTSEQELLIQNMLAK